MVMDTQKKVTDYNDFGVIRVIVMFIPLSRIMIVLKVMVRMENGCQK